METVRLLSDSGGIIRNHHLVFCKYTEIHFILLGGIKAINKSWCSVSLDYISKSSVQFSSVQFIVLLQWCTKKQENCRIFLKRGSPTEATGFIRNGSPSLKLLQQNFNRIIKFFFDRNLPTKWKGHWGKIMICRWWK